MAFQDILAAVLNPNGVWDLGGTENRNRLAQAGIVPHDSQGQPMTDSWQRFGPELSQSAPVAAPQQAAAPAAPTPSGGGQGGGLGGFISGLFQDPAKRSRNQTVDWLQGQGLNEGHAKLLAANPPALQKYLLSRYERPQPLEVNGRLVDPNTYQVVADFSTPQNRHTTTIGGKLVDANTGQVIGDYGSGTRPMSADERQQWGIPEDDNRPYAMSADGPKLIGGSGVNVNVGGEKGYDNTIGTGYGKRFLTLQDDAQNGQRALNALKVMDQATRQEGFYSGTGAGSVANLKRFAAALNLPGAEGIDSIEAFNALAKQSALDIMGGSLGTGFSNADRDFVLDQVPNLDNSPAGNAKLIEIQKGLAQRKIDIAKLARTYADQNGGRIDAGFDDFLMQWADQNPLFPEAPPMSPPGTGMLPGNDGRSRINNPPARAGGGPVRARNPQTGETIELRNGQWVPVQ